MAQLTTPTAVDAVGSILVRGLAMSKANLKVLSGACNLRTPRRNHESPASSSLVSCRLVMRASILSPFNITLFTSSPKLKTASRYAALYRSVDPISVVSSWMIATVLVARTLSSARGVLGEIDGADIKKSDAFSLCTDAATFLPMSDYVCWERH